MGWFAKAARAPQGKNDKHDDTARREAVWRRLERALQSPDSSSADAVTDGIERELIAAALAHAGKLSAEQIEQLRTAVQGESAAQRAFAAGKAWESLGRADRAEQAYRDCIACDASFAKAYNQLGLIQLARGNWDDAIASFGNAVRLDGTVGLYWNNLGVALWSVTEVEDAMECYRKAWQLAPEVQDIRRNVFKAALEFGQTDLAREVVDAARAAAGAVLDPSAVSHTRHGILAADPAAAWPLMAEADLAIHLGEFERAESLFCALSEVDAVACQSGRGAIATMQGRFEDAEGWFAEVLKERPGNPMAMHNLGFAKIALGKLDEGLELVDRALGVIGGNPELLFMKAVLLLKKGRWQDGWAVHEARLNLASVKDALRDFQDDLKWAGEDLQGKTLALVGEQGAGDRIQFVRYASVLAQRGAEVVVYCEAALKRLCASVPGVARVVVHGEPVAYYDYWIPMLSLPAIVGADERSIPSAVPYFFPDAEDCGKWSGRVSGAAGLRVGLAWAGSPALGRVGSHTDKRRSIPLAFLAPLWGVAGVSFFSLQKGQPRAQLEDFAQGHPITDHSEEWRDFADTAAFMTTLDLIISVDTSVAHLAGALGKPVWILSRFDGCWRWLDGRNDSPWYPTARVFHQEAPGEWGGVIQRVVTSLGEYRS